MRAIVERSPCQRLSRYSPEQVKDSSMAWITWAVLFTERLRTPRFG